MDAIRYLCASLIFVLSGATIVYAGEVPHTDFGADVLAIESVHGANASDQMKFEELVAGAVQMLRDRGHAPKSLYTQADAEEIFIAIQRHLRDGPKLRIARPGERGQDFLFNALRENYWDCDTLSFLYIAIGERLGLPIKGVLSPGHMFVRFVGDAWSVNMDPRVGGSYGDAYYRSEGTVPAHSRFFLRTLERSEVLGFVHYTVGAKLVISGAKTEERDRCVRGTEHFDHSLRLFSANGWAYQMRSLCKLILGDVKAALRDADDALHFDPFNQFAYLRYAEAVVSTGEWQRALLVLTREIERDARDASAYYQRGYIQWVVMQTLSGGEKERYRAGALADRRMACTRHRHWCDKMYLD